jgi:vesicle coat complex subunit
MTKFQSHMPINNLHGWIHELENPDGLERKRARFVLESVGKPAVPALIRELSSSNPNARWEAAKALAAIRDPQAAPDLVKAMEDENASVRWAATDAMISLDRDGLKALFEGLTKRFNSVWLREGAHHVLHVLANRGHLTDHEMKVFHALEHLAPEVEVPWAAETALEDMILSRS